MTQAVAHDTAEAKKKPVPTTTAGAAVGRVGKPKAGEKLSLTIHKFVDDGDELVGEYLGSHTRPWTDKTTGEEKDLTTHVFRQEDGSRVGVFEDAGLRNQMGNALVEKGERYRIVYLGQVELDNGRRVNQYDIYAA